MTDYRTLLELLTRQRIDFILVGGVAAALHGSTRLTHDVGLVCSRDRANLARIARAFADQAPYLRDAPPGLPFALDESTLRNGLNFTLTTKLGPVDLLGEIPPGFTFETLLPHTLEVAPFGLRCRCIDLSTLIRAKRAAGRLRDLEAIAELEKILQERGPAER